MTRLGPKSQSRRGRTSRRRLVGLNLGLLRPAISDDQSENYDNGEDCCQPRPHRPRAIRHLAIDTAQWIGAARTGVAGIRHDSPQFLRGLTFVGKETANRSQCSYARFARTDRVLWPTTSPLDIESMTVRALSEPTRGYSLTYALGPPSSLGWRVTSIGQFQCGRARGGAGRYKHRRRGSGVRVFATAEKRQR